MKSFKSTTSKYSRGTGRTYRSRYAFGKRKEKPPQPNPEKINFDFASYRRDDDLVREMTLIPEEMETKKESDMERERTQNEAKKRGEEVVAFVEKEMISIDQCKFPDGSVRRSVTKERKTKGNSICLKHHSF